MSEREIHKKIIAIFNALPTRSLLKLRASELEINACINKIIDDVYTEISANPKLRKYITHDAVHEVIVSHLTKQINMSRSSFEQFNYQTVARFAFSSKIANTLTITNKKAIKPQVTRLSRVDALSFLPQYETKIATYQKMIMLLEKRGQQQKADEKKEELRLYREAVFQIKGNDADITIIFPPFTTRGDLAAEHLAIIKNSFFNTDSQLIKELRQYIKLVEWGIKKQQQLAQMTVIDSYCMEQITVIVAKLKGMAGPLGQSAVTAYVSALIGHLVTQLDATSLVIPLSKHNCMLIEFLLNFKKYSVTECITLSTEANALLDRYDLKQLQRILEDSHRLERYLRPHHVSTAASKVSKNLSQHQFNFITLFHKVITQGRYSTFVERNELSMMLEQYIGDMVLNKRLDLFKRGSPALAETYKLSIDDIKYLGFKARISLDVNSELLERCEHAITQLLDGAPQGIRVRINLYELGRLFDLAKLKDTMDKYNDLSLIESRPKLRKLYAQVNRAAAIFEAIEEHAQLDAYKSGDLCMLCSRKALTLKNNTADTETALTHIFISQYGHAAQIYTDPDTGKPALSHIYGKYQANALNSSDIIISDVFRVDPLKLIGPAMEEKLALYFEERGLDYKSEVRSMFEQSIRGLHTNNQERFATIENDKSARFHSGLADFYLYGGHTLNERNNLNKIHHDMYQSERMSKKMICSEFVARSLVAALYETNKQLKEVLGEQDEIIRSVFAYEHIRRVHPGRLINILQREGCLEQVPQSNFLMHLIDYDNLAQETHAVIKTAGELFYDGLVDLAKTRQDVVVFHVEALELFKIYIEREQLELDLNEPRLKHFLEKSFKAIHPLINDNPHIIIRFFRSLKLFLGFKPEAQQLIEKAIGSIESIQIETIKSKVTATAITESAKEPCPRDEELANERFYYQ